MSRWREVVREELARYRAQTGLSVVSRQELLDQSRPRLEAEFPDNNTRGQSLSKTLQQLRKRDELGFLTDGEYRILSLDRDATRIADAVESPTGDSATALGASAAGPTYTASEYETTATGRRIHSTFRTVVLDRYGACCPVSGVDRARLLDVAHVLPWRDYPDQRAEYENVFVLDKTHHAAFDAGLFTLDADYRLRVSPSLETGSELLRRTLADRDGERIHLPGSTALSPEYLETRNERLEWEPT